MHEEELNRFANTKIAKDLLSDLVSTGDLFKDKTYYGLQPDLKKQIALRLEKEERANAIWNKIYRYARIVSSFPYVRGVGISGSISKNVMAEDGDVDFFIITKPGRLWLCRSLLILFKKTVLLNSRKYFCINYLVDEDTLEIPDKNMFTAVEIRTLIPVFNSQLMTKFNKANVWVEDYLGEFDHSDKKMVEATYPRFKNIGEWFYSGWLGEKLDIYFMNLSLKRWKRKFGSFNKEKFELTMRTSRKTSKHHPLDFQNKVINEHEKRLNQYIPSSDLKQAI